MASRPVRIAINGFGRIGRCILRAAFDRKEPGVEFVAINDLTDSATNAHLLKYDSVHGTFAHEVGHDKEGLSVDGKKILVTAEKDPGALPWKKLDVDVVLECTGRFTDREMAAKHLEAGSKRVIISAPAKKPDITICFGVNHEKFDAEKHRILSNASCTTNCLTPMAKVVVDKFGLTRGLMTTIHSYTNDQQVLDLAHKDLRRARAAALSMIPTTTGAAKAVSLVIPELEGKLDGLAIRVPTPNVSLVDLVCDTGKDVSAEEVNEAMKAAANGAMKGILQYETTELVSHDFNHNPHSCIFDATMTRVQDKRLLKIMGWYDNEWGFSNRMVDLAHFVGNRG